MGQEAAQNEKERAAKGQNTGRGQHVARVRCGRMHPLMDYPSVIAVLTVLYLVTGFGTLIFEMLQDIEDGG